MESAATPATGRAGLWGWLDERLGIGGLRYPVPEHANSLAYTLGGLTVVSFVGLVLTGIYLFLTIYGSATVPVSHTEAGGG